MQDKDRQGQIAELLELIAAGDPWVYDPERPRPDPHCFFCQTDEKEYHGPGCPWARAQHLFKDPGKDQTETIETKTGKTSIKLICHLCGKINHVVLQVLQLNVMRMVFRCSYCEEPYVIDLALTFRVMTDSGFYKTTRHWFDSKVSLIFNPPSLILETAKNPGALTLVEFACPRCHQVNEVDVPGLYLEFDCLFIECSDCKTEYIIHLTLKYWTINQLDYDRFLERRPTGCTPSLPHTGRKEVSKHGAR